MTTWQKDPPPSGTTSSLVGCAQAGVATVGDVTECITECDPPPDTVVVITTETVTTTTEKHWSF